MSLLQVEADGPGCEQLRDVFEQSDQAGAFSADALDQVVPPHRLLGPRHLVDGANHVGRRDEALRKRQERPGVRAVVDAVPAGARQLRPPLSERSVGHVAEVDGEHPRVSNSFRDRHFGGRDVDVLWPHRG
jgi:hypothetical protein